MDVFFEIAPLRRHLSTHRGRRPVVLVPTMGALHDGHRACIDRAHAVADGLVAVSIFVNPLQFNVSADLDSYPQDTERDINLCAAWGADVVFAPQRRTMYPAPQHTWVEVDDLSAPLEGEHRPDHFRGVTTVVTKLFNIVAPDMAVFGQKDAQQALVILRMIDQLDMGIELLLVPTVRESDGLAMSSRNRRLDPDERRRALAIVTGLRAAGNAIAAGERDRGVIEAVAREHITAGGITRIDYVALRRASDLSTLEHIEGRVILAVAAHAGATRLIDNMAFDVAGDTVTVDTTIF